METWVARTIQQSVRLRTLRSPLTFDIGIVSRAFRFLYLGVQRFYNTSTMKRLVEWCYVERRKAV